MVLRVLSQSPTVGSMIGDHGSPGITYNMDYIKYNGIIVFICTDAWAPICIFLHVSGQNESVQLKAIGSLYFLVIFLLKIPYKK